MSLNSYNLIKSLNDPKRNLGKHNNHSLSPNVRPIYNPAKPIKNNLFPKNRIMYNNNNYNIKVNVINKKKEKIIEGDLNFNDASKHQKLSNVHRSNFLNNKPKNPRGMPRKSPLPIPRSFKPKGMLNFNRIFTAKPRPNTKNYIKPNNMFQPQGYMMKSNNIFGGRIPSSTSKSFNSMNLKNDRSHSPILRSGQNKIISLGIKPNKNRYVSKSPILGKGSSFNRNGGNFGISMLNNGNKIMKKVPKKEHPQANIVQKKINNINNVNANLHPKRNTIISGEMYQDSSKLNKVNNNLNNERPISVNINSLKPISNNNIKINNISNNSNNTNNTDNSSINNSNINKKRNENEPKSININNNLNNKNNEKQINREININMNNKEEEKININIISNKDVDNTEKNSEINKVSNNANQKEDLNKNEISKNIKDNKSEEIQNKKNKRSQSQGPIDPLKKEEEPSEKKEEILKSKNKNEAPKKVMKVIKDLLPYTHVGFDGEEPKENNQDNYFIFKNFADHKDYIYMSVCDGHGVEGHFVSEFIKEVLPYYMSENLKDKNILKETEIVHQIITETFLIVNNMLVENENINSLFSGSTCVSVIFTPERLIVPNIGDSRAVLGRYDKTTGKYKAIELSRDHKPTEKDEAKRIYENDGRIQPFTEDGEFVGPQRVWIKEEEVPGLAMTRSFGDRVAATVGVMSEPEIKEFNFEEEDKYMIIASDGIWEFISSQECIDIIQSYYESNDLKGCCEYLYQESSKRWLKEEEVIDDTTLILVFFE